MIFKELALQVLLLTFAISVIISLNIKKSAVSTIDGMFAILGIILGSVITFLNFIYSNNYLLTIGPIMIIACALYLANRKTLLKQISGQILVFDKKTTDVIKIIYWICITTALVSYYTAEPYYRPPLFFISISIAVASLGLEIISSGLQDNVDIGKSFIKIFILSIILRFTAFFISPYPVGSDPWYHAAFIEDICKYGTSLLPEKYGYYSNYPIMHIFASITSILGKLSVKESMAIIGLILVFSTVFVYLIIKTITNNKNVALFSVLLLNVSDFHIQWSIQVIAMTFGIALYSILIYLLIAKKDKFKLIYKTFFLIFSFLLIWTHTVSSFIFVLSLISLYPSSFIYKLIYGVRNNSVKQMVGNTLYMLLFILLIYHWMNPNYPFFQSVIDGLINSLLSEADFLGRSAMSNVSDSWISIIDILGFLIVIFLGIIGTLYSLSVKYINVTKLSLICMLLVLFFVFFVFPLMGMRNIVPYRWPAFIYTTFMLFAGITSFQITSITNNRYFKITFVLLLLSTFSFFMTTNSIANMDSPIYGENLNQELFWKNSEIILINNINNSYSGYIVSDLQTNERPFQTYLKRTKSATYMTMSDGNIDWDFFNEKIIIWRKTSISRPLQLSGGSTYLVLGQAFKDNLDNYFNCVYDTGCAKGYGGS